MALSETAEKQAASASVVQFHTRNVIGIVVVFLALFTGFMVFMAVDFHKLEQKSREALAAHFLERVIYLDQLLQQVGSSLEAMKTVAEADLFSTRDLNPVPMPPIAGSIAYNGDAGYFHMDSLVRPFSVEQAGNLTGQGPFPGDDPAFLREIRAALALNPLFHHARQSVKTTAWVYYISARRFIHLFPWVSSDEWKFTTQSYSKDFFKMAVPEVNPHRGRYWTPVYVDEVGKGLMVTCGVPVYDGDRFLGAVALDLTVDFLNGIAAAFRPDKGTLFLINDYDQVLAHPRITSSGDMAVKTVDQAIPPGLDMDKAGLAALPGNRIASRDGWLVLKADLFQAPWQVVYIEPVPGLWSRIRTGTGPGIVLLFAGLLTLVLLVLISTHYLYVVPADRFIRFILDCSRGRRPESPYGVPRMWKPWFATIDRTFAENAQLTARIRQYSEELEIRVTRRTAELIRLNTTLNAEILAREKAQDDEQRMARILDQAISQSPSGIVVADAPDMRIHTANRAAFEIRGKAPDIASEGHVMEAFGEWEIFDMDRRPYPAEKLPLFRAIRKGEIVRNEEIIIKDIRGRDRWLIVNASPVTDAGGKIVAGIVIFHDYTDRREIEKEKLDAQKFALEQAKHALVGQVAGKMAHDFNNILGVIMGNAELALAESTDREMKRIFALILGQTHRGKNLTKNLVAFARDQEPKQAFFNLNKKIDLVLDLMKKDLARIRVETRYEPDLPKLLADPGMIEHMLVNLIQNAVHAVGKSDRPMLIIRTFCRESHIGFDIEDNGCGIPQAHLERIYEPAFTLKGSRDSLDAYAPEVRGTGYGMANVKKYIEQHRGRIRVRSAPGKGTCFTVSLPLISGELTLSEKEEIGAVGLHTRRNILLVEDESAISDIQVNVLTGAPCHHRVDLARTGEAAVALLDENQYDIISLDYVLPGSLNGIDVYMSIREKDAQVPVLFVSGNIEFLESVGRLREQDDWVAHLSKPCLNREYVDAINRLLDKAAGNPG